MSDNDTSEILNTPSGPKMWLYAVVSLVGIALFIIIVSIAYLPNRPAPIDESVAQERRDTLAAWEAEQIEQANTYAVLNPETGAVRIPIKQAMEIYVQEAAE